MFEQIHNDVYAIDNPDEVDDLLKHILLINGFNDSLLQETINNLGED